MNTSVESPSALRRKLTIEVEPVEIKRELDKTYNELRRTVQLKGFRPGHAPRNLLERFFGDQVRSDVIQRLVKEYTDKALEKQNLKPIVTPEVITEETDLSKTLRFSAVFDITPELEVRDYDGLEVARSVAEVGDADVDTAVERMRERQAALKKVEGRTFVEPGDFVLAELDGIIDGKPVPTLHSADRLFEVSPRSMAHRIDEVFAGAEVGKAALKTLSYPEDYAEKELAGKNVEWRAEVKEIFAREMPALDDEFARDQGYESIDDLRAKARASLLDNVRREADSRVRQALIDMVIERNSFELPESLVERERQALETELAHTLQASGVPHERAHAAAHERADELLERAQKRARTMLVADALARQEKLEASDEEVADRIGRVVREAGRNRDQVARHYAEEDNRESLRAALRREKALDLLFERARITDAGGTPPAEEAPPGL
jgi:trigger factor